MLEPDALAGRIAVVAGATRGAGRGIARALGEAGATVYCVGRSVRGSGATPGRSETIDEAAELVTRAGGRGIAVRCDCSDPADVERFAGTLERVDLLVNDIWGGDPLAEWGKPFWEQSLDKGRRMMESGLWTHLVVSRFVVPIMVRAKRGLVVEIGDGHLPRYRECFFYDLVKASILRVAYAMAEELRPHGVTAVALTPGFLRSEAMLDHFGVTEATWRDAIAKDPHFAQSETPLLVGRAVAALAADPNVAAKAGRALAAGPLAKEYGFTDADGTQPDWAGYFDRTFPAVTGPG